MLPAAVFRDSRKKTAVLDERVAIQKPQLNGNERGVGGVKSERRGYDNKSVGIISVSQCVCRCLLLWLSDITYWRYVSVTGRTLH